jgi:hypothetical protein
MFYVSASLPSHLFILLFISFNRCHVYIDKPNYTKLPEPTDEENDMLDLAFELKEKYGRAREGKGSRRQGSEG